MRLAWMPRLAPLTGMAILVGCALDDFNKAFSKQQSAAAPSTPASQPHAASPASEPATDTEVTPLASRVQDYVAQFPEDDRDREAAARARASREPTSAPWADRDADRNAGRRSPTPSPASPTAPQADAKLHAMAPKSVDASRASPPVPPTLQPQPPAPAAAPTVELSDVRPAANAPATPAAESNLAANQPVQGKTTPPGGADTLLNTIQQLEQQVALQPQQLDDQFRLRLLYAATGNDEKAAGPIKGASAVQSDLLAAVFRVLSTSRQAIRNPSGGASAAIVAIDELRRLLGQQSPIVVSKTAFVTRVNSFGDYDAVPPRFSAGQGVHVFLYTEVSNFRSEPTDDNRLRTVLAEKVEIYDAGGKLIWQKAEPQIEDRVFTPRRDFFMTMEIKLPETTPAGDYVLKVTIEDKLAAVTDQQRMTFTIAAK